MFRKAFPARAFATFSFFEGGRGDFPAGLCRSSVSALIGGMGGKRRGFRCVPEAPAWPEAGMCEGGKTVTLPEVGEYPVWGQEAPACRKSREPAA